MALSTYTELQASLKVYAKRSSLDVTDAITLAHKRIINGAGEPGEQFYSQALRLDLMLTSTEVTLLAADTSVSLPSGYLEMAAPPYIELTNGRQQLVYVPPSQTLLRADGTADQYPIQYTIKGRAMRFANAPGADVDINLDIYSLPALSADNLTNLVLTNHPDCYLFGALVEIAILTKNWAEAQSYFQRYVSAVHGAQLNDDKAQYAGGLLTITPDTETP